MDLVANTTDGNSYIIPIKTNNETVYEVITKDINPNPIIIIVIVGLTILILIYIYVMCLKTDLYDDWYGDDGEEISIVHNKWNNVVKVSINQKNNTNVLIGYMIGNAIYMSSLSPDDNIEYMGVFKDDVIYWATPAGKKWRRAIPTI